MIIGRARAYLATMDPAISGSGGHDQLYRAAMVLAQDFALDDDAAMAILREYNSRCQPPFGEPDLLHKIQSAKQNIDPARLGRLSDNAPAQRMFADAVEQLASIRGFSAAAMRSLGTVAEGNLTVTPMRNERGEVTGHVMRRGDGKAFNGGEKSMTRRGSKNGLFMPWPFPPDGPALVVEGLPDTWRALTAGWSAVVGTPGAKPGRVVFEMLQRLLAGRAVILAPHGDDAGRQWMDTAGRYLANAKCIVRFIPAGTGDLDDRLRAVAA